MPDLSSMIDHRAEMRSTNGSASSSTSTTNPEYISSEGSIVEDAKYYWLGRICFQQLVARHIFQTSESFNPVSDLDAEMDAVLAEFPYRDRLGPLQCQVEFFINSALEEKSYDARQAYLTVVGMITSRDQGRDVESVAEDIRQCVQERAKAGPRHVSREGPTDGGSGNITGSDSSDDETLGVYMTALKEHMDRRAMHHEVQVTELSLHPPQFKAKITVNGMSFEGLGKNKKLARHSAARDACEGLRIRVPLAGKMP